MYEVEVKVEADHGRLGRRLEALGAEHVDAVRQEDTYYDAPHRDFAETDEALRIRRERSVDGGDWSASITYKGPLLDDLSKSREEAEIGIDDGRAMGTVLDRLGFAPVATVCKERERYRLEGYTVTLDSVDGLGEFVEVETEVEENVEAARDGAFERVRELGLDPERGIRTSYLELLLSA